jgi:iron complex outermembrane receptor protein
MRITTGQRRNWLGTAAVLALGAIAAPAAAQGVEEQAADANAQTTPGASMIDQPADEEIVVTARRAAESLQDVPIALTVYSGEALERGGAVDITDISDTTPNVTLEVSRGSNTTLTAFIRGVGQQDPVAGIRAGCRIVPGRRVHQPAAGGGARHLRRRADRGAARAAGDAVRPQHDRRRD